jgi:hypothetical protein
MRIPQLSCENTLCQNCGRANYQSYTDTCIDKQKRFNYDGQQILSKWILTPESSNIARFAYRDGSLTVVFKNGGQYAYFGVPMLVFKEFNDAYSKGKYFAKNIKGAFEVQKIEE